MNLFKSLFKNVFGLAEEKPPDSLFLLNSFPSLIGKIGRTRTPLSTTGLVEVDGQEFEAESQSGFLKTNVPIKIVGKHMSWLLVEAI